MAKLMVGVVRVLSLCAVLLLFLTMMLPSIAFAQQRTLAINPTQNLPGTIIPVLGNAHQAITFLTQMITLAMQNGGEGQEAQLEALKQQIEALPKPKRGDRKAARLQNDKGLEEFKKERYEQALQFFLTAYQLDAGDVEVVNNVGMVYLKTGNLPEAARYLGGALSLAPNRAAAWGNLAEVFARDARLEESVAAYALTYRYSKNKDATRRLLEAQTRNVDDPQVMQTAKAALALLLISSQTASGEGEYRVLAEKKLGGLKEQPVPSPPVASPVPTPTPRAQETEPARQEAASPQAIQSAQPAAGMSGDPAAGKASCKVLEPPPVPDYEQDRRRYGNITATWSGSCVNGLAQGTGTLTWHNEGLPFFTEELTGTNGLVMNAGRAAASDVVNERATTWRLERPCPPQYGDRTAIGQVSMDLNLGFPVVVDKLLELSVQFVFRSCTEPKNSNIRIRLYQFTREREAVTGVTGKDGRFDKPPPGLCSVGGYLGGYQSSACWERLNSGKKAWQDVAQQRAREAERAGQEAARQQAIQLVQQSRQRYDEFTQKAGIDVWLPSTDVLQVNPFVYEGKVVGIVTQFEQMLTKDRGLFRGNLLVSSIPLGRLQQPAHLLLAGRVLGKEPVETPQGGKILLPHLKYEDIYICQANSPGICHDVLFWQRQQ